MRFTLGVALGAILVALGALQASGIMDGYERYVGAAIAALAAVSAYLHAQGVDGSPQPQPPSP